MTIRTRRWHHLPSFVSINRTISKHGIQQQKGFEWKSETLQQFHLFLAWKCDRPFQQPHEQYESVQQYLKEDGGDKNKYWSINSRKQFKLQLEINVVAIIEKNYSAIISLPNTSSTDTISWLLLNNPGRTSHAPPFTIHLAGINLAVKILLHNRKWRDNIRSAFFQSLHSNNIWPTYKNLN